MDELLTNGQAPELDTPSVGSESQPAPATAGEQLTNDAGPVDSPPEPSVPDQPRTDPANEAAQRQWLQERQQYQAQLAQAQREQAEMREILWQIKLANTPETERAALVEQRNQQEYLAQRQQVQQERTQFFKSVEPIMKEVVVNELLNQYRHAGVTKEELAAFSTPEDAENYAKAVARRFRTTQAQRTATTAQAASTQGAPVSKGWKSMTLSEQLQAAISSQL
jgi:hypothetical protein